MFTFRCLQVRFRTLFTRNVCLDKKHKSVSEMFPDDSMVLVVDDNKGAVWTENQNLIKVWFLMVEVNARL